MKIAVFGSHGFIGGHLCKRLEQDHEIIRVSHEFIDNFEEVNLIINLMSYGNIYGQTDKDEIFNANVTLLYKLLKKKYKHFINFSSSSVTLPVQTMYSTTKRMGEELIKFYRGISVRPYTVIGIMEQREHLIPTLIRSCLYGEEMSFVGEPTHDFIDVEDLVNVIERLIEYLPLYEGEVIPIGSGQQHTNYEVRLLVEELTGKKANVKYVESLRSYDSKNWVADTAIIEKLNCKPKTILRDIIFKMVEYEKHNFKNK